MGNQRINNPSILSVNFCCWKHLFSLGAACKSNVLLVHFPCLLKGWTVLAGWVLIRTYPLLLMCIHPGWHCWLWNLWDERHYVSDCTVHSLSLVCFIPNDLSINSPCWFIPYLSVSLFCLVHLMLAIHQCQCGKSKNKHPLGNVQAISWEMRIDMDGFTVGILM